MLSPEVQERLDEAASRQDNYEPNKKVRERLAQLGLVMLVGPAAVGKTHIIKATTDLDRSFSPVSVFTTRDKRPDDDPDLFSYYKHTNEGVGALLDRIEHREVVNYAIHPTTGNIYGTVPEDYHSDYNMLATLANGVEQFLQLPFKSKHVIGVSAEPAVWARWFNSRYPKDEDRRKRLAEAILSLDWLLAPEQRPLATFIKNEEGKEKVAAQEIIDVVMENKDVTSSDARSQSIAMRGRARGELKRIISEEDAA